MIEEMDHEYNEIIDFCSQFHNDDLAFLFDELEKEKLKKESKYNSEYYSPRKILIEIADLLSGYPSFNENKFWNNNNREALDMAYYIYKNLINDLPGCRSVFCSYLEGTIYDDGIN